MEIAIIILSVLYFMQTVRLWYAKRQVKELTKTCNGARTVNRLLLKELRQEEIEWPEEIL